MSDPRDPFDNPPGWTDPYSDLTDLTGDEPVPPLEDESVPPATPPRSPLLTGLIVGLLLVTLSIAVFQLLRPDDSEDSADVTTTTLDGATTTTEPSTSTTVTSTTVATPPSDPYPPVGEAIPVGKLKLMTAGIRINDNDIPDLEFGDPADVVVGRLTASFGEPNEDTGWQVSTGQWGVCEGDLERIVRFGPFAAIVMVINGQDVFMGYRQNLSYGDLESAAIDLETLSGLKAGDTVETLQEIYANQVVTFTTHAPLGEVFELRSSGDDSLLLWGPVRGQAATDLVIGIHAPDACGR